MPNLDRLSSELILIVDDVPDNLSLLHDALEESGYTLLVACDGESALQRARQGMPDAILLDAVMPGMDGFEVARRLKADYATRHIPIVFMTGLTETEHVVAAFAAGGSDYVTKPIRPREVLARVAAHVFNTRQTKQARAALDAFGQATLAVSRHSNRMNWQTPLARQIVQHWFADTDDLLPAPLRDWLADCTRRHLAGEAIAPLRLTRDSYRLVLTLHNPDSSHELLVSLREESDATGIETLLLAFRLTRREAEVLYWTARGKTSPDIGDILGTSPRTVNKHLEHVFEKLGVETRTAAAALAMEQLHGGRATAP